QGIDYREIGREGEYRENDHAGGGPHLRPSGPGDALHFELEFLDVVLGPRRPAGETRRNALLFGHIIPIANPCFSRPLFYKMLAGAEGFEPPKAVLETAGLPLA